MTNFQALLTGALLIAVGVVIAQSGIAPAKANPNGGPYALMQHSNPSANAGVFRVDTSSGEVSYCYVTSNNALACSQGVK